MDKPDTETRGAAHEKLLKRLRPYWKMELFNIFWVPALAIFLILYFGGQISIAAIASMVATSFLLVVGTFALKMMVDKLEGNFQSERQWVPYIAIARWPALVLIAIAIMATAVEACLVLPAWPASLIASVVLTLLAILEYINYYHYQVQHFDHAADWKRLLSGKGFRRSHLSRSIAAWQRRSVAGQKN
jgi:hypothetical protein